MFTPTYGLTEHLTQQSQNYIKNNCHYYINVHVTQTYFEYLKMDDKIIDERLFLSELFVELWPRCRPNVCNNS